jgi:hypothetical protein
MKNTMHTVYMGMKAHSNAETSKRAKGLAKAIGSYHLEADIDAAYQSFVEFQNLLRVSLQNSHRKGDLRLKT